LTILNTVQRRAARRYMAGPGLADALQREEDLRDQGLTTVVGYWNAGDEAPDTVERAYNAALDALAGRPAVQLACKPPAVALDPGRIDALAERGRQAGVPLHFDSVGPEVATPVLEAAVTAGAGATLPGRWLRSPADADRLASTKLPVRVIKGQWPDSTAPDLDPRDGYMAVVERLAGRAATVGVATHDGPLAAEALQRLRDAGTPCELQLLLGLPAEASLDAARDAGVGVRIYVSYGTPYLPYALRSAAKHPLVAFRLVVDLLRSRRRSAF
jgi:proline dehydrogenase